MPTDDLAQLMRDAEAAAARDGIVIILPSEAHALIARLERAEDALSKINDVRNSIIGLQSINWSEHIYPLVAALEDAGVKGAAYPKAKAYMGSLLEQIKLAEKALREMIAVHGSNHQSDRLLRRRISLCPEDERVLTALLEARAALPEENDDAG